MMMVCPVTLPRRSSTDCGPLTVRRGIGFVTMGKSVQVTMSALSVQGPVTSLGACWASAGTAARHRATALKSRMRIAAYFPQKGSATGDSYRFGCGRALAAGLELGDTLLRGGEVLGLLEFLDQPLVIRQRLGLLRAVLRRLGAAIERFGQMVIHRVAIGVVRIGAQDFLEAL